MLFYYLEMTWKTLINHIMSQSCVYCLHVFFSATVEIALATAIAGFLHVVTRKLVATFMRPCRTFCARAPSGFEYKWNIHCMRVFTSRSWPHHCLNWMFLENICIYSHAIGLVTHMLDCHDLANAGHYWMTRIRGDLEVGIRNADW